MATHRSAKKRHVQSLKRRARNNQVRKTVRGAVRKLRDAAAAGGAGDKQELLKDAERLLRKASSKGSCTSGPSRAPSRASPSSSSARRAAPAHAQTARTSRSIASRGAIGSPPLSATSVLRTASRQERSRRRSKRRA